MPRPGPNQRRAVTLPAMVRISNRQGEEGSAPPRNGLARGLVHRRPPHMRPLRPLGGDRCGRRGEGERAPPRRGLARGLHGRPKRARPRLPLSPGGGRTPSRLRLPVHAAPGRSGEERADEGVVRAAGRVPGEGSSAEDWGLRHCGRREEAALFSLIWGEKEGSGRHDSVGIGLKIRELRAESRT